MDLLAVLRKPRCAACDAASATWRGQFSGGTYLQGSPSTAPVSWPGYSTTAWYQGKPPQEQNRVYMGTVLQGQRDASGQVYKRNRMYDPQTGQFTQTDPIGVAGGLNTYGFAAGDPVSYVDPFGLSGCSWRNPMDCVRSLLGIEKAEPQPQVTIGEPRMLGLDDDQPVVMIGGTATLSVATVGGTATGGLILWSGEGLGFYRTVGYAAGLDASVSVQAGGATRLSDLEGKSVYACVGASLVGGCVSPTSTGSSATAGLSLGIDDLAGSAVGGVAVTKPYTVGDLVQGVSEWAKPGLAKMTKPWHFK